MFALLAVIEVILGHPDVYEPVYKPVNKCPVWSTDNLRNSLVAFTEEPIFRNKNCYSNHFQLHQEPLPYYFNYDVHDDYKGAHFGQNEKSDGKAVYGSYTVALPDGRKQLVVIISPLIINF